MKTKYYFLAALIILLLLFVACYFSYQAGKRAAERDKRMETEKIVGEVFNK